MLTNPQLNYLEQKEEDEATDLEFLHEINEEMEKDKLAGEFDALEGNYPKRASEAYLEGYCNAIKSLADPSDMTIRRPNSFPFLSVDDDDIPF